MLLVAPRAPPRERSKTAARSTRLAPLRSRESRPWALPEAPGPARVSPITGDALPPVVPPRAALLWAPSIHGQVCSPPRLPASRILAAAGNPLGPLIGPSVTSFTIATPTSRPASRLLASTGHFEPDEQPSAVMLRPVSRSEFQQPRAVWRMPLPASTPSRMPSRATDWTRAGEELLRSTLAQYRHADTPTREVLGDRARWQVQELQSFQRQQMEEDLSAAAHKERGLARMLAREGERLRVLARWGLQAAYVPESALQAQVLRHAQVADPHAMVMAHVLRKALQSLWFSRWYRQTVWWSRCNALQRIEAGVARRLAVRGPIRAAWLRWQRFVLVSRYAIRARLRHEAAQRIQHWWRERRV